jgi:hypothetical protein
MLEAGRGYPDRVWAIEGCNGIGKHLAHRLVHDGETVVDVPAKLSATFPPRTACRRPRRCQGQALRVACGQP